MAAGYNSVCIPFAQTIMCVAGASNSNVSINDSPGVVSAVI